MKNLHNATNLIPSSTHPGEMWLRYGVIMIVSYHKSTNLMPSFLTSDDLYLFWHVIMRVRHENRTYYHQLNAKFPTVA